MNGVDVLIDTLSGNRYDMDNHPRVARGRVAQGGVTLKLEQGESGAGLSVEISMQPWVSLGRLLPLKTLLSKKLSFGNVWWIAKLSTLRRRTYTSPSLNS